MSTEPVSCTALIVDDNPHMRTIVATLLHAVGVTECMQAADGAEARAMIAQWSPDLVIVDQNMRPVSGIDFARTLRRGPEDCFDTPIIMLTAHTERSIVIAARDAGIDEILAKPISAKALMQRLHAVTHERRQFIRCASYVGPDRRRRTPSSFTGPFRRFDDSADRDTYALD